MLYIYLNLIYNKKDEVIIHHFPRKNKTLKLTRLAAKKLFQIMASINKKLYYYEHDCSNDCKLCKFVTKYYKINFNVKELDFAEISKKYFEEVVSVLKLFKIKLDNSNLCLHLDESIFFK